MRLLRRGGVQVRVCVLLRRAGPDPPARAAGAGVSPQRVHPGPGAGGHRGHRAGRARLPLPVEDPHLHTRQAGVRQVREGAHARQVGHGRESYLQAGNFNV